MSFLHFSCPDWIPSLEFRKLVPEEVDNHRRDLIDFGEAPST